MKYTIDTIGLTDFRLPNAMESALETILEIQRKIPEFKQRQRKKYFKERLDWRDSMESLVLVAHHSRRPVGCLVSVGCLDSQSFWHPNEEFRTAYMFFSGVLPAHRNNGLFNAMQEITEYWAEAIGYSAITLRTFPECSAMITSVNTAGFVEEPDPLHKGLFFRKKLHAPETYRRLEFSQSRAFQEFNDKFDLNMSWNIKDIASDRITSKEPVDCRFYTYYNFVFESGRQADIHSIPGSLLLRDFEPGDTVEYGVNAHNELAWFCEPRDLVYFRRRSK